MSEARDVEEFAVSEFSDLLLQRGFATPRISCDEAKTRIDYFKSGFAIEVELDWRDFIAFVLIVRLEDGHLPAGYYMSGGRKCRKHLAKVVQEQKWEAPAGPRFDRNLPKPANVDDLKKVLLSYKNQLSACVDKLIVSGSSVI